MAALPFDLPAILLFAEVNDPSFVFKLIAASESVPAHVEITNSTEPQLANLFKQDWYFDPATSLPQRVEYVIPSNLDALNTIPASCTYAAFSKSEGILFPTELIVGEQGKQIGSVSVTTVTANPSIGASEFDLLLGSTQR
jgi:hypothetical protein